MFDYSRIPFVAAKWFTTATGRKFDLIVVHDMEYPERLTAAEDVAHFFAGGSTQASAHFCIDADSIVQSVLEKNVAWHAPGANSNGIGLEHAGYAAQRADEWADAYSAAELALSAQLAAVLCKKYAIPAAYVDVAGLLAGHRGITTHNNVSLAFKQSSHTDPGPNFPMARYIDLVRGSPSPVVAPPTPTPLPTSEEITGVRITSGMIPVANLDDNGRGWVSVPSPLDRVMFIGTQGSAPSRDGYWPPVGWDVNDSGTETIVTLDGKPGQQVAVYYKVLEEA